MKKHTTVFKNVILKPIFIFSLGIISNRIIAQQVCPLCPNNLSFESGDFSNWTGVYGNYKFSLPTPVANPNFSYVQSGVGTPNLRYAITSGTGVDPNISALPVKAPCGGNYSARIGYTGSSESQGAGNWPYFESLTYTLLVTPQTTGFTYMYAAVLVDGSHDKFTQPQFDVEMKKCSDGTILPCGQYSIYAGNGSSQFHTVGKFNYTDWTSVTTDLTNYIGQQICITFRVRDCMGNLSSTNGDYSLASGGGHQGYAYIDTYCSPIAQLDNPEFCAGAGTLKVCAPSGYQSYSWPAGQPGLSGSPTTQCVTINNPVPGTKYTVNMTSFGGCPATVTIPIKSIPTISSADTVHSCPGDPDTLSIKATGNNGPYSYVWSHNLGTGTSVVVKPTVTTTYTVTITNAAKCTDKKYFTVIVDPCKRELEIEGASVCPHDSVLLVPTITGAVAPYVYNWQPGGFSSSTLKVSPTTATIYTLTVTDATGISMTDTANVIIRPVPIITINSDTVCAGQKAIFIAHGATNYVWPTGFSATGDSATITPIGNATYTLTGSTNGCADTVLFSIIVKPTPSVKVNSATICTGDKTILSASGATTYQWLPSSNLNPTTGSTVYANPFITTTYTVTGTSNNCSDTATATVTVFAIPDIKVNSPGICDGETALLIASGANTYTWSPGVTIIGQGKATAIPSSTTSYTVTGSSNNCKDSAVATVTVHPAPVANFSGPKDGCLPVTTNFIDASSNATKYFWNFGDGESSTTANPIHTYKLPGIFNVSLIVSNGFCSDTLEQIGIIKVYSLPQTIFTVDKNVVFESDPNVVFTNQSVNAKNCLLTFGDGSSVNNGCSPSVIPHAYPDIKEYCAVLITTSEHGCVDKADLCIEVKPETTFYVPNAFTPGDNGKNEIFYAYGTNITQFQMQIYNRWGEKIFESNDINKGWNGRYKNNGALLVQQDVYVCKIIYQDIRSKEHYYYGTVTVVR